METPAGTRVYVPNLKRYFILIGEDSGATKGSETHFNPAPGKPITVGPLTGLNGWVIRGPAHRS
jgi:hypothetical protein